MAVVHNIAQQEEPLYIWLLVQVYLVLHLREERWGLDYSRQYYWLSWRLNLAPEMEVRREHSLLEFEVSGGYW